MPGEQPKLDKKGESGKPDEPKETSLKGIDGKSVKLRHSKVLTAKRWYDAGSTDGTDGAAGGTCDPTGNTGSQGGQTSNYDAKRDAYADYDPESYKAVLATFKKNKKRSKLKSQPVAKGPIYDKVSRTNQTPSARNRADTAHYLKELSVFGELEFDDGVSPGTAGVGELLGNPEPRPDQKPAQSD